MLDTLRFSGANHKQFPLITILNFLASLQTHPSVLPDTQLNQIRVLKLQGISCFEDCSDVSPIGLAGLEILHINWPRTWSDTKKRRSSVTACEVLAKMIKATRYTLQSLKIDFSEDSEALRKFDIRMLAGNEDDVGAWKKLRKLRVTIDVDSRSQLSDIVGTLEDIADMFPNLETLELMINAPTYDDATKYTPDILKPLSKLKSLHCLKLALDFERDTNDEYNRDIDIKWYNRCLHRRHAATQAIVNVCPLTRCYWENYFSNLNDKFYRFVIGNESGAGKPDDSDSSQSDKKAGNRVVKVKMLWWMEPWRKYDLGDDLPCEVVGSHEEEYNTSDSDE
ncbi:hypothetical protein K435DRAFT_974870 [Dendrothele bispora CBS 962.96]|uniref:Uncharacterized protein n=1 Tax=Dendrothele bispora (strain CBS 962.96) TaxID=1314807 RepID=A0A4S8KJ18_DENBC|nr:hypothetical protein K435DRAFT_974870 [Dendrothele bispora CBS 962.96]